MKKILKLGALVLAGALSVASMTGCAETVDRILDLLEGKTSSSFEGGVESDASFSSDADPNSGSEPVEISRVSKSSFYETSNKYRVVDSYMTDDGNYYYFYYLGAVDYVPLNLSDSGGVYFDGGDLILEFTLSQTNRESSEKTLKNVVENSVDLKTTSYVKGSVGAKASIFQANIEAGISNQATSNISNTFTESYSMAVSKESTFQKKITYKMNADDEVGFYFYTAVASMQMFEVVVYNPNTNTIEYMSTYSQVGAALPGLYYSPFSFLDYSDFEIEFDESKLPAFETPTKKVSSVVTVAVDAGGASCGVSSLDLKIGNAYGVLPEAQRNGYVFKGWYCDGQKIEADSLVVSATPIVAKWEIVTSGTFSFFSDSKVKFNRHSTSSTVSKSLDMANVFDIAALKKAGYKMRIVLDYKVSHYDPGFPSNPELRYNFIFKSNNKNISTISDTSFTTSSYEKKTTCSNDIDLSQVSGSINFELTTNNLWYCYIRDLLVTVEFVK